MHNPTLRSPTGAWCRLIRNLCLAGTFLALHGVLGKAEPLLSIGTVPSTPNQSAAVPLRFVNGADNSRTVVALQSDVHFEDRGIESSGILRGDAAREHQILSRQLTNGVRRILVYSLNNRLITNGVVGNIPFKIAPEQFRNFPLTLSNVILADAEAKRVNNRVAFGGLAVAPVNLRPDGVADFFLQVEPDKSYTIQATTDFLQWVDLEVITAVDPLYVQIDADAGRFPHRFYRASPIASALTVAARLDGNNVVVDLSGGVAGTYVLQATVNLVDWLDILSVGGNGMTSLSITNAISPANPHRFYRGLIR